MKSRSQRKRPQPGAASALSQRVTKLVGGADLRGLYAAFGFLAGLEGNRSDLCHGGGVFRLLADNRALLRLHILHDVELVSRKSRRDEGKQHCCCKQLLHGCSPMAKTPCL